MLSYRTTLLLTLVLLACVTANAAESPQVRAFPEAEGFGAYAQGGRGGRVIAVTTLEDYVPGEETPIPGSLRAAIETPGRASSSFGCPASLR